MALIVYNRENSRPQEVTYKGKRTINLDSRGTVYLSKTMSIELGILGGGRVNFAHDDETDDWYICRADDSEGFIVWKDKRCARFSAGFIVQRLMRQAKVERKSVQFMMARSPAVYDMTETGASDGTGARRMCLFLCAAMFTHGHAVVTGRHKVTPKRPGNGIAGG